MPHLRHLPPVAVGGKLEDLLLASVSIFKPDRFVSLLEERLCVRYGSRRWAFVSKGRTALAVALLSMKKRSSRRTEVVIPAYSNRTVVQAVLKVGLKPIFCDVNPRTLAFDIVMLEKLVNRKTLAVIPTYLYGIPHDIADVVKLVNKHGSYLIEDTAQAFTATYQGNPVGIQGDFAIFSLGRGKTVPSGGGGLISCSEPWSEVLQGVLHEFIENRQLLGVKSIFRQVAYYLATTPLGWWFVHRSRFNSDSNRIRIECMPEITFERLAPVHAAICFSILNRVDKINEIRTQNASRLRSILQDFQTIHSVHIHHNSTPSYIRYPVVLDSAEKADQIYRELSRSGLGVSRSYTRSLPDHYQNYIQQKLQDFPGANHLAQCLLTLPTHHYLKDEDFRTMEHILNEVLLD